MLPNPNNDPQLNANVRVTLTGHSTGLGLRTVTPLNPRAFVNHAELVRVCVYVPGASPSKLNSNGLGLSSVS